MATTATHAAPRGYVETPAMPSRGIAAAFPALTALISSVRSALAERRRRNVTMRELSMLSDRELDDIGISRCDIPFVAARTANRSIVKAQAEAGMI